MKRRVLGILAAILVLSLPASSQQAPQMTLHFIDVGQALSALLEFPCGAMLVDAGNDAEHEDAVTDYLTTFFQRRTDLNQTLDLVLITHNHKDHTSSLRAVVENFTVKRYIDDGFDHGSGAPNPNWLRREVQAGRLNVTVRAIRDKEVTELPTKTGLTDQDIDPFSCGTVDPRVRILSGSFEDDDNPGWPDSVFENQNNHSLVTRVDFGAASMLFTGDLEEDGIETLLEYYDGASRQMLNTGVLQVGHHGSHNATTAALLRAVTPSVALIPVGRWNFGGGQKRGFNTFSFGHPRQLTLDLLAANMTRARTPSKDVMAAEGARKFHHTSVTKAIYATGWDGTIRVAADTTGRLTVRREH